MRKFLKPRYIILLAALLVLGGGVWFFFIRDTEKIVVRPDYRKTVNDFTSSERSRISDLAAKTTSIDELKKLSPKDQADVGIFIIQQKITQKDAKGASEYAAELMKRDDATGIGAAKLCYSVAQDDATKAVCKARATELARAQGIIGPTESLPDTYFDQTNVPEQG